MNQTIKVDMNQTIKELLHKSVWNPYQDPLRFVMKEKHHKCLQARSHLSSYTGAAP